MSDKSSADQQTGQEKQVGQERQASQEQALPQTDQPIRSSRPTSHSQPIQPSQVTLPSQPAKKRTAKLAVFISGTGSNLRALQENILQGTLDAQIVLVVSSRPDALGIAYARSQDLPTIVLTKKDWEHPLALEKCLVQDLRASEVDYIVLAGYMRKVQKPLLKAYPDKIINLHPALLPAFKGAHAIAEAYKMGVKVTGVTVHYIDQNYDEGTIIAQEPLRVEATWSLEELEAHIHDLEHIVLPRTMQELITQDFCGSH